MFNRNSMITRWFGRVALAVEKGTQLVFPFY
jgi:hypothetical protein